MIYYNFPVKIVVFLNHISQTFINDNCHCSRGSMVIIASGLNTCPGSARGYLRVGVRVSLLEPAVHTTQFDPAPQSLATVTNTSIILTRKAAAPHFGDISDCTNTQASRPSAKNIEVNIPGSQTPPTPPAPRSVVTDTDTGINYTQSSFFCPIFAISV
jgi:hypothetical protein